MGSGRVNRAVEISGGSFVRRVHLDFRRSYTAEAFLARTFPCGWRFSWWSSQLQLPGLPASCLLLP